MHTRTIVTAFVLVSAACSTSRTPSEQNSEAHVSAVEAFAAEDPVLVIHLKESGRRWVRIGDETSDALRNDGLPFAAWADGRIVWEGTDGLFQSSVGSAAVGDLIARLTREGAFGAVDISESYLGCGSDYEVIEMRVGERRLRLASWHGLFEANPNTVGTARGIEALEGRNRESVLAQQPESYRRFLRLWSEIRTTAASWIPSTGVAFEGSLSIDGDRER